MMSLTLLDRLSCVIWREGDSPAEYLDLVV